jgi:hypothetical protein
MTTYLITMGGTEQGGNRHNVSYGIHRDYTTEANRLFESAAKYGINCLMGNNDTILNSDYAHASPELLTLPSFGWTFKPILIFNAMLQAAPGDYVIWCDSNHVITADPAPILEVAELRGVYTHDHPGVYYPNSQWTRRDTFVGMNCDEERFWNSPQMQVNVMAFHVSPAGLWYAHEWLSYALAYNTIVGRNKYPDLPGFREHRHEQSIWSILVEKWRVPYSHQADIAGIVRELDGIAI